MKSVLIGLLSLFIVGTGVDPQKTAGEETWSNQLDEFVSFAEGEHLEINSWTITMKEALPTHDLKSVQRELRAYLPEGSIKKESNRNANKWTIDGQKTEKLVEQFIVILPKNAKESPELVYVLSGAGTSTLTKSKIDNYVQDVKSRFFSKNVGIFSCLKAKSSGIIDDVLVYQKFQQLFNIATIEEVIEPSWTSRSGYTETWGNAIPLAEKKMNVQFATRTLGGKTNITIGTPIITAEY